MGKLSLLLLLIQPWIISPAVLLSYVMFKIILDYLDSSYICATTHTCRTCMCSALLSVLMVPALHACVRVAGPKIDIFWSRPCARFLAKRTSYNATKPISGERVRGGGYFKDIQRSIPPGKRPDLKAQWHHYSHQHAYAPSAMPASLFKAIVVAIKCVLPTKHVPMFMPLHQHIVDNWCAECFGLLLFYSLALQQDHQQQHRAIQCHRKQQHQQSIGTDRPRPAPREQYQTKKSPGPRNEPKRRPHRRTISKLFLMKNTMAKTKEEQGPRGLVLAARGIGRYLLNHHRSRILIPNLYERLRLPHLLGRCRHLPPHQGAAVGAGG